MHPKSYEQIMKIQLGPSDTIFPVPAALVVSSTNEDANIITLAWIGIAGSTPPTISISLKKSRYSLSLIKQHKEFTVNFPTASFFKEVDYCGITTGRNKKKFDDTGFTKIESSKIDTPLIEECPHNMECKVRHKMLCPHFTTLPF